MKPGIIILCYAAAVSLVSAILCIYDKLAAKRAPGGRVRERTLFLAAAAGGSLAMYTVMLLIRHKTKHKRFMAGLPAIAVLQLIALLLLYKYIIL